MPRVSRKKGAERFALVHSLYNQGSPIDKIADTLNLTMASTRRMLKFEHYSDYLHGKHKPQQLTISVPTPQAVSAETLRGWLQDIDNKLDIIDAKLDTLLDN